MSRSALFSSIKRFLRDVITKMEMRSKIFKETRAETVARFIKLLMSVRAFKAKALSSSNDISDHTEIGLSAYLPSQHKLSRSSMLC